MDATDRLISFSLSDVGRTRKENQDAYGEFHNALGERLLITADGMGGHAGGVRASRLCVESVGRVFETHQGTPAERLRLGLEEANHAVFAAAEADDSLRGMGTTGVALLFDSEDQVWLGWVGDSRAYRYRAGELEQLSDDHSVVADWVRQGVISAEEADTHPRRNELMRAIGPDLRVEVDIKSFPVEAGDIYLLCSDGLCGFMRDDEIAEIVGSENTEDAVRKLVDTVNDERNSPDNITVQIVRVPGEPVGMIAGAGRAPRAAHDEEVDVMGNDPSTGGGARILIIGVLLVLLGVGAFYGWQLNQTRTAEIEAQQAEQRALVVREQHEAEAADVAAAEAARLVEAARLEAKAAADEEARLETARLAEMAREEEAAREAALLKEIADAKAALFAEEAALAAEAAVVAEVAAAEAAERERILAEQELRRQEAIAEEEARAVEMAFNMAMEVDAFVSQWVRALDEGDYSLYKRLGFRESEDEFRTLYPDNQAAYEIAVLEKKQWVGGFVALRVSEIYDPPGSGAGSEPQQTARRLVLRPTTDGMRFAGDRN